MIWILLVVLAAVGGIAAARGAFGPRPQLAGPAARKALVASAERALSDVRVNDIVTIEQQDYVCEGVVGYDEDGHRWTGARCVDGQSVKWIVIGLERAGAGTTRLLEQERDSHITGYPPEAIVVGDVRYALDKRGTATCALTGDTGGLGNAKRAVGSVERCRWWLYSAPGDDTLVVEQWGDDYRVLRGKKIGDGLIELMQAS